MTDEPAQPDRDAERAAERGTQSSPSASRSSKKRYSRDELSEQARNLLGVSPHAIAGGLHGQDKQTFTLDEAAKLVNAFLRRPEAQPGDEADEAEAVV